MLRAIIPENFPMEKTLTNIAAHTSAGIVLNIAKIIFSDLQTNLLGAIFLEINIEKGMAKIIPINEEIRAISIVSNSFAPTSPKYDELGLSILLNKFIMLGNPLTILTISNSTRNPKKNMSTKVKKMKISRLFFLLEIYSFK